MSLSLLGKYLLYWIFRAMISLRYRLVIKGLDKIKGSKGILFLPNHPAEMDPIFMIMVLWRDFKPQPLVVEHFYYLKVLRWFMDLVGSIPLPTMDVPNGWKIKQIEKLKNRIISGLKAGQNFLIYPSGKLKTTPDEQIGGASMTHDLLHAYPEASIVLIRTSGLWGSIFSTALTNHTPDPWEGFVKSVKILLKNGLFFAPRRTVTIELEWAPTDFPRKAERRELNRYLEKWYNRYPNPGPEPLNLVSYCFWRQDFPKIEPKKLGESKEQPVPSEIEKEVIAHLAKVAHRSEDQLGKQLSLSNDLGLDSLDSAQLYVFLEERYQVAGLEMGQIQTVNDLLQAAAGHLKGPEIVHPHKEDPKWPSEPSRRAPQMPRGETIEEVFLRICDEMGSSVACRDALAGMLTYRQFKRAALVFSLKIRELPGEQIGIMLPASVAAYLVVFAVWLAGKQPVMFNWTAGAASLEHAAKVSDVNVVLSSYRFLSRLQVAEIGAVDDLLLYLEDIRYHLSLKLKLKGFILSFFGADKLLAKLPKQKDDTAVIIFTSGTETMPKGVPLTHANLLTNERSALTCIKLFSQDLIYGVLPPFHSFGLSVTGLVPILIGLKVCYGPDPTNSRALARDIDHWKPTLFCCAPGFIQSLLRVSEPKQLASLRLVVTGAEKAPEELFEAMDRLKIHLMEGYGISECSPIVTLVHEGDPRKGVGKPIPGVELCVIDPESSSLLPEGSEGEICIRGPNVFSGYLGIPTSPFIELSGKRWYRSGDRGKIDPEGNLILTGRLKRFIKAGGEMISLGGVEEDLMEFARQKGIKKEGPVLAVVAVEGDKPELVLFTTFDASRDEVNQWLKDRGHARLIKISDVRKISEIPLTGTGKTQYRLLESQLKK